MHAEDKDLYRHMNVHTSAIRQILRCATEVFWAKESWQNGQWGQIGQRTPLTRAASSYPPLTRISMLLRKVLSRKPAPQPLFSLTSHCALGFQACLLTWAARAISSYPFTITPLRTNSCSVPTQKQAQKSYPRAIWGLVAESLDICWTNKSTWWIWEDIY